MRFPATTAAVALLALAAGTACVGPALDDTTPIEGSISGGAASTGSRRGGGSSVGGASGQGTPSGGASSGSAGNASSGGVGSTGGGASSGAAASSAGAASSGSGGPSSAGASSGGASTGAVSGGASTSGGLGNGSSSGGSTGSAVGSTAGGGGSTGAAGCNSLGTGLPDLTACSTTPQCNCPDVCNNDPALGAAYCEPSCTTSSDCVNPITVCRGGVCVYNLCGPSGGGGLGGGDNGVASGVCSAAGVNDGSCWPSYTPADPTTNPPTSAYAFWFCYQGGVDATGNACQIERGGGASTLCTPGDLCLSPDGGPNAYCTPLCDPTAASPTCPSGSGCGAEDLSDDAAPNWGVCYPEAGGCLENYTDDELSPCGSNSDCGCVPSGNPLSCVDDPSLGINLYNTTGYCERTCTKTSPDCPIAFTSCNAQKQCSLNECGTAGSGVGISARCNAAATQDGTCIPSYESNGSVAYGLCYQGGPVAVDGTCDPDATRTFDEAELCVAGAYCFSIPSAGNLCIQVCNPDAGAGACPGATCNVMDVTQPGDPPPVDFGICEP